MYQEIHTIEVVGTTFRPPGTRAARRDRRLVPPSGELSQTLSQPTFVDRLGRPNLADLYSMWSIMRKHDVIHKTGSA